MKRLLLILGLCVPAYGSVANIYYASASAGVNDGTSCANAYAYNDGTNGFSIAGKWGAGASQIGAGTTAHICGTITGGTNSVLFTFQGSGSSGNPVTLKWETGAIVQAPYFSNSGAIVATNLSFITVDGGSNGLLQCTLNGTSGAACPGGSCTNQQDPTGVYLTNVHDATVHNLTISSLYVRLSSDAQDGGGTGININNQSFTGTDNIKVQNNTIHDESQGIFWFYGTSENGPEISGNTMHNQNAGISAGAASNGDSITGILIHDNVTHDYSNWDDFPSPYNNHHDGIHIFGGQTGNSMSGCYIYNNEYYGAMGFGTSPGVYIENLSSGGFTCTIFNNLFHISSSGAGGTGAIDCQNEGSGTTTCNVYNNTGSTSVVGNQGISGMWIENTGVTTDHRNNIWVGWQYDLVTNSSGPLPTTSNFNDYYTFGTDMFNNNGATYDTVTAWHTATGKDANSTNVNPNLDGTYHLQAGSPAIGLGANLFSTCNGQPNPGLGALCFDKSGTARPTSAAWDAGAFQFNTHQYYIATTGSDSNPGTIGSPFLTFAKALSVAGAGDTVNAINASVSAPSVYGPGAGNCTTVDGSGNRTGVSAFITTTATALAPLVIQSVPPGAILDEQYLCAYYFSVRSTAAYVTITGFEVIHGYTGGILVDASNITISHNEFDHIGNYVTNTSGGLVGIITSAGSSSNLIDANTFHDIGRSPGSTLMFHDQNLYFEGTGNTAVNNIFYNMLAGWGIAAKVGTNYTIANNTFYGSCCINDGTKSGQIVVGDSLGGAMSGVNIQNNVFLNPKGGGGIALCFVALSGTNLWTFNDAFGPGVTGVQSSDACSGSTGTGTITLANNITTNPNLVSPAAGNFRQAPGSPVLNAGTTVTAASPDILGLTRPQGSAYSLGPYDTAAGCTASVTSPMAASTQSGIVSWTASVTGCPTGFQTQWILDDFYPAGLGNASGTLVGFNTGIVDDGPFNAKVVIRDGAGVIIATSPNIAFKIQNFGIGITVSTLTSASGDVHTTFNQTPTVSGTLTFGWTTSVSPTSDLNTFIMNVDGQEVHFTASSYPPSWTYDTTQLINGVHLISTSAFCKTTSATCGTNPSGVSIGPSSIQRMFTGFLVNVQNGLITRGVQPSVEHVTLTPGQTYPISALLAMTDGSTSAGSSFTWSLSHACVPAERTQTSWLPYPCASGNSYPPTSMQGSAYISLTTSGSSATITANLIGESYITITDTISGTSTVVPVAVVTSAAVSHMRSCGTISSTYVAGGGCPSLERTSIFNIDPQDTGMQAAMVQSNLTAFENQWWLDPGNNGGAPYPNFATWLVAWQAANLNPITSQLAAMPGLCLVMRSEGLTQNQGLITQELGPSSGWTTLPLPYALAQLKTLGKICGNSERDEANAGYGVNPIYSMKFSDSSIGQAVCKSNVCMVYHGTANYPTSSIYGTPQGSVFIRNATTAGLNGSHTVACTYRTDFDAWLFNTPYCNDPSSGSPVADAFTFNATVADGTYNVGTDATLEILGWATYTGWATSGSPQMPNNSFSYVVGQMRTAGIPQTWPILGSSSLEAALYWRNTQMADYNELYANNTQTNAQGFPWGPNFTATYRKHFNTKWGTFNFYGAGPYWQQNNPGFVTSPQGVPQSIAVGTSVSGIALGGVINTIVNFSGSTLTTASPHGIPTPGGFYRLNSTVAGNSDGSVNHNWIVYPTGASTLEVFSTASGITGCTASGALGTATIRSVPYTITNAGGANYPNIVVSTSIPSNVLQGELVTISGAAGAGCNGTYAFHGYSISAAGVQLNTGFSVAVLASSTGTGGTIQTSISQGALDPLHDYNQSAGSRLGNFSPELLYSAGEGFSMMREYGSNSINTLLNNWNNYFPNNGAFVQTNPEPYTNQPVSLQKAWWDGAPGMGELKRLAPLFLQSLAPSPLVSPGPPYVVTTLETGTNGNILQVWNISEISQAVTVPIGTFCQIGNGPISVYEVDYPHSTSDLLTGTQTVYNLTMNPGQLSVFACHPAASSFVNPTPIPFTPPGGTARVSAQIVYGNYNQPLSSYTRPGTVGGATSPILVNIDPSVSDVWYTLTFLDSSDNVISTAGPTKLVVSQPPVITSTSPLPGGTQNVAYSTTLTATGTLPITWAVTSGSLPTGLTLSGATISGTPTVVGTSAFTITATNADGSTPMVFSITIAAGGTLPVVTSTSPLPAGVQNVAYSTTLTATGSTPITWSVTVGSLPTGLSLNSSTGTISGTPTVVAGNSFTATATNSFGTGSKPLTLNIAAGITAPVVTTTSPLPYGVQNVPYSTTLAATGTTPITWSVTVGSLPTGLSLNSSTGVISGTPTVVAVTDFTVTATNGAGSGSAPMNLSIVTGGGGGTLISGAVVITGTIVK